MDNGFYPQFLKKEGLPLSLLHRVNRICDIDENYVEYASEVMKYFRDDSQAWLPKLNEIRSKTQKSPNKKEIPVKSPAYKCMDPVL